MRLQYCIYKFLFTKFWVGCFFYHTYLITHVVVVRSFWKSRHFARIEKERKRVRKIWKEMLKNKKENNDKNEMTVFIEDDTKEKTDDS